MKEVVRKVFYKQLYKSARSRAFFTLFGIVLKELKVAFRQFFNFRNPLTLLRVISVIFSSLNRIFLGRYVKYSFAFTGEDKIIEALLKPLIQYNGYYIDVGCNHPIHISNTYGLYRKGWRGICIDANAKLINKYKYFRPRDIAINALVSDEAGKKIFYIAENEGLSTAETSNLTNIEEQGIKVRKIELEAYSLTKILEDNNAPKNIDLLSIDVEEFDLRVLKSLDFQKYRPRLVILEEETFKPDKPKENEAYKLLINEGYEFKGFILKNLYFQLPKEE